eukprot:snap_masked-scaffold_17-processed-gene-0.8-mRNA-1 protein AED:1.00 eAED:1.00 QI:0/0/0/0/1/1/2/0/80
MSLSIIHVVNFVPHQVAQEQEAINLTSMFSSESSSSNVRSWHIWFALEKVLHKLESSSQIRKFSENKRTRHFYDLEPTIS